MTERSLIDESTIGIQWGDPDAMGQANNTVFLFRTVQARTGGVDAVACAPYIFPADPERRRGRSDFLDPKSAALPTRWHEAIRRLRTALV